MQSAWKQCSHPGKTRPVSPSRSSDKQTEHSTGVPLLVHLGDEQKWGKVGSVSCKDGSSPIGAEPAEKESSRWSGRRLRRQETRRRNRRKKAKKRQTAARTTTTINVSFPVYAKFEHVESFLSGTEVVDDEFSAMDSDH
ncbi:unnamed protein product [Cuscuta epithymum]|uniref:Uncharacterized protein n=1 Tax=Cuscuta epithymum TaxID=186058 RepID=A0AAV0DHF2_9ASTE|nr:unnamed protein product [Cuscuta epithymum]